MKQLIGKTVEWVSWADDLHDLIIIFTDGTKLMVKGQVSPELNNYTYVMCEVTRERVRK